VKTFAAPRRPLQAVPGIDTARSNRREYLGSMLGLAATGIVARPVQSTALVAPIRSTFEEGGWIREMVVYPPAAWQVIVSEDRPVATEMDRPGWYFAIRNIRPTDALLAQWEAWERDGIMAIDRDDWTCKPVPREQPAPRTPADWIATRRAERAADRVDGTIQEVAARRKAFLVADRARFRTSMAYWN